MKAFNHLKLWVHFLKSFSREKSTVCFIKGNELKLTEVDLFFKSLSFIFKVHKKKKLYEFQEIQRILSRTAACLDKWTYLHRNKLF